MSKDRVVRIIGFSVFILSVLVCVNIEAGKIASFILGLLTGLGVVALFVGQRMLSKLS